VTVGLAKIFVHESGWIPDLLGRVTYEIPTGPENSNQVALPSRRSLLGFSLTGTKRQDPLVFVVTGGYSRSFSTGKIDLGDQANLLTGAFLATSPETSLRAVLQENFVQAIRVHNVGHGSIDTDLRRVVNPWPRCSDRPAGRNRANHFRPQIYGDPLRHLPLCHGALSLINWPKRVR
jgi:hypothetical protein